MSWTLTKKLGAFAGPGEIKRRDPPVSPGEIKNRQVELGLRVRLLLLHFVPNSGAADIVFVTLFRIAVGTAIACYGSCWGMPSAHSEHRFRHLPPNCARFSYATEGALFISAQLSSDAVSALQIDEMMLNVLRCQLTY